MTTYIYGASDDLLEIEGDVFNDEFGIYGEDNVTVEYPGGSITVTYDNDGMWRLGATGDTSTITHTPARGEDAPRDEHGRPGHSDVITIDPDPEWLRVHQPDRDLVTELTS